MTIPEIINRYKIKVVDGDKVAVDKSIAKHPEHAEFVKAHKQEIIAHINAEAEAKKRTYEERQAKIAAIEGLDILKATISAWEVYNYKWEKFIAADAIGKAPVKPTETVAEVMANYPRAAAYIKAEGCSNASHYVKAAAGKKAKEAIINGEDYEKAIADMEAEWRAYCDNGFWD